MRAANATLFLSTLVLMAASIDPEEGVTPKGSMRTTRSLTFEQRVEAQEAIERVYFSHRIGTTRSFEEAVPREVLEDKVRNYLAQSVALEQLWNRPVTGEMLRAEMERMARSTRIPDRLGELFVALENDAFLIQECLARQILADRLARELFTNDEAIHREARREAESLRKGLLIGAIDPYAEHPSRIVVELVVGDEGESGDRQEARAGSGGIHRMTIDPGRFTRLGASVPGMRGTIGTVDDGKEAFTLRVILDEEPGRVLIASYSVSKRRWDDWWRETSARFDSRAVEASASIEVPLPVPVVRLAGESGLAEGDTLTEGPCPEWVPTATTSLQARASHTAVWTGSEMIVWGGYDCSDELDTGARYDPATDSWAPTSLTGAPTPRRFHTAVWTGSEMIVWGGYDFSDELDTGARYDPATDSWTPTNLTGAPTPRRSHTAVWTGSEMIVWGGPHYLGGPIAGGRYDPVNDTWTSTTIVDAPSDRYEHTAVWTGTEMIVWGGQDEAEPVNTGSRYSPATDSWTETSRVGAPSMRKEHTAVWTGTEMIVWGGDSFYPNLHEGGRYEPITDSWIPIMPGPQIPGHHGHSAVWTGREMIIWGGYTRYEGGEVLWEGGWHYDPVADSWSEASSVNEPTPRADHTAVWTGHEMIVWGGYLEQPPHWTCTSSGGRYSASLAYDDDGDGLSECDGDCDDANSARYPGNPEICDGIDNDCDLVVPPDEADDDGDGSRLCDGDCDDTSGSTFPGAAEIESPTLCMKDSDDDGFGDDAPPVGVLPGTDCDDGDRYAYPGHAEVCDQVDNDCDGGVDEGFDADDDGVAACVDDCPDAHDPDQPPFDSLVAQAGSGEVSWFDLVTGTETPLAAGYSQPTGVTVNDANTLAYFGDSGLGQLIAFDLVTVQQSYKISGLGFVEGVTVDRTETYAYVASSDRGELLEVELQPGGGVAVIASGLDNPAGVALSNDGKLAYVTERGSGELSRIHLTFGTVTPIASGLQEPTGLALDGAGAIAYVAEYGSGELSAVDLATGQVTLVRTGLEYIRDVALGRAETTAYVVRTGPPLPTRGGSIEAVDLGSAVVRTIATGLDAGFGIALRSSSCPDNVCQDGDADGFGVPGVTACSGGPLPDCDDADATRFPGNPEVCDGVDNNCDGSAAGEIDEDSDGYMVCQGDCDDTSGNTYPGAVETNDGVDNQCPGDHGFGVADEVSGEPVATSSGEICWPAQPGAVLYEVAFSGDPEFSESCTSAVVAAPCWSGDGELDPGAVDHVLVRSLQPHLGSWGYESIGSAERVVACSGENDCSNGLDDDVDGLTDCQDADCLGDAACQPNVFQFYDGPGDDIPETALQAFFTGLTVGPSDYILFELSGDTPTDGAWCAERADFYVDTYLNPPPPDPRTGISLATSGSWNKWWRSEAGPWSAPTLSGFSNRYSSSWWDSEVDLGGLRLTIDPGHTGTCEAEDENQPCTIFDPQRGMLTIKVGSNRYQTCGF